MARGSHAQVNPDGILDLDRGRDSVRAKQARLLDPEEYAERADTRDGHAELDAMLEQMPGLSRLSKDRQRATPRATPADIPRPVMERRLPEPDAVRIPISGRQRKTRSVTKRRTQSTLPHAQYTALDRVITDNGAWDRINTPLSRAAGDAQELDERTRQQVQRLDRAIQAYESRNDRGHVVYANVTIPDYAIEGGLHETLQRHLPEGTELAFDRFTGARHTMHELETPDLNPLATPVLEIQTRRGMYLGMSDRGDNTAHLLPRGMRLVVVGTQQARYRRPDGSEGRRVVIQLRDTTPPSTTLEDR